MFSSKKFAGIVIALSLFGFVLVPAVHADGLNATQVSAILIFLQSFGADQTIINNVSIALGGATAPTLPIAVAPSISSGGGATAPSISTTVSNNSGGTKTTPVSVVSAASVSSVSTKAAPVAVAPTTPAIAPASYQGATQPNTSVVTIPTYQTTTQSINASAVTTSGNYLGAASPLGYWNSGGLPPQWIEFDLGSPQTISGMSLSVEQSPNENTVHDIYAGPNPNPTTLVKVLMGYTSEGQVLTPIFSPALTNVRYIRVTTTASPSWVAWGNISFTKVTTTVSNTSSASSASTVSSAYSFKNLSNSHIQQFGYYDSAANGVGSGDYIAQVAPISNVVWVRGATNDEVVAKVASARQQGLGVVLMTEGLFFGGGTSVLLPNGNARFDALWAQLQPYQDSIKGFYVLDEPFGNNDINSVGGGWVAVSDAQLTANLNSVANHLHAVAPSIPSIIIFSYPEITRPEFFSTLMPHSVNWIGFDCYLAANCSLDQFREEFFNVLNHKDASQKIVLVPDAYWASSPTADADAQIAARLLTYQGIAAPYPDVVAIYPFIYQTIASQNMWGAQSLPKTLEALTNYFQQLLGR